MSKQISDTLRQPHIKLGPAPVSRIPLRLHVVVGQTGSGKTRSIVLPVSVQLAELRSQSTSSEQAAVFFFGVKGEGHEEFIAGLSPKRRKQVIWFSAGTALRLFDSANWTSQDDLCVSIAKFIEEVACHVVASQNIPHHDPFWDRQRRRVFDGPASLIRETRRYGVLMARIIPAILACVNWELSASIKRFSWNPQPELKLTDADRCSSSVTKAEDYDSKLEQTFAAKGDPSPARVGR